MRSTKLLLSTTAAIVTLAASPALAQEAGVDSGTSAANQTDDNAIIVTARRIDERLQDVPASVSVLTADDLQKTGAERAQDFVALTPGVTIVTGTAEAGDTQINIRGINGARDAESSVALVVDGILKTNTAQLNQQQGTLRQVEILKGPQGALYGRNAAAGAIVIQTLKPGDYFEGGARASYGEHNTWSATGYVAGPVSDNVGALLSTYYSSSDGFFKNIYLNNSSTVDDKEDWSVDGRVMVGRNTATQLDIKARYGEFHGASLPFNAAFALPGFAAVNPAFDENVNDHVFRFYNNIRATNDQKSFDISAKLDQDLGSVKLVAWALYSNVKQDLVADGTSADFARYSGAVDPTVDPAVQSCVDTTAALTGFPVNQPGFIGTTPTPFLFDPVNGSTFGPYSPTTCDGIQYQVRDQEDISGEIRLMSNSGGPIEWQLGGYYLHIDRTVGVSLGADTGQGVIKELYNPPSSVNPTSLLLADKFKTDVYAAFGSLDWKATDTVRAGLALRYDIERRKSSSLVPNVNDPFTGGPINPGQLFGPLTPKAATFRQFEPKVTLNWEPVPNLNLYANWGIGFKSGGFNNQGSAALIDQNFNQFINAGVTINDQYDKEWSSAWEAGIKGSALNGRLTFDLAGYYTQVHGMQFFEFFVGSFGLLRVVSNIDLVDIKGAELNLTAKPLPFWKLYGSFNVTDSEIKRNASRPYTVGNKSPYTADYTINLGTEVDAPLDSTFSLLLRADYRITGPTWFHTVQCQTGPTLFSGLLPISQLSFLPPEVGDGNFCKSQRKTFGVLNLRAGIETDRFNLAVFADNALNEKYLAEVIPAIEFGGSFISPGARRVIGVEVGYKF